MFLMFIDCDYGSSGRIGGVVDVDTNLVIVFDDVDVDSGIYDACHDLIAFVVDHCICCGRRRRRRRRNKADIVVL